MFTDKNRTGSNHRLQIQRLLHVPDAPIFLGRERALIPDQIAIMFGDGRVAGVKVCCGKIGIDDSHRLRQALVEFFLDKSGLCSGRELKGRHLAMSMGAAIGTTGALCCNPQAKRLGHRLFQGELNGRLIAMSLPAKKARPS